MKNTNKNNTATANTTDLRSRILTCYESVEDFSSRFSISVDKLAGRKEFILEDIIVIRSALNLNDEEVKKYFFPDCQPKEKQSSMIDLLAVRGIIERLKKIEDGLNALDMMTTGKIRDVGDTISNEDFRDAFGFIMAGVMDKVTDLRADLTAGYFQERTRIGQ